MIVACVLKSGGQYGPVHVRTLQAMVARHLPIDHQFWCLSDTLLGLPQVITIPLMHDFPGWWAKIELWRPGALPAGSRILYMDLDSVVCGDLSQIASQTAPFVCVGDVYRRPPKSKAIGYQSSIMLWTSGHFEDIYRDFVKDPALVMAQHAKIGDQGYLERKIQTALFWEHTNPGEVVSFKKDCRSGLPQNARIVDFHGKQTKPWTSTAAWVKEHYR